MNISVIVLITVFVLIAVRKIGHFNIKIWQSMTGGALIIGTPLVLRLAREHTINSKLLLLTLAYAITIGSVMSPIGNPQNSCSNGLMSCT